MRKEQELGNECIKGYVGLGIELIYRTSKKSSKFLSTLHEFGCALFIATYVRTTYHIR